MEGNRLMAESTPDLQYPLLVKKWVESLKLPLDWQVSIPSERVEFFEKMTDVY
jgi:hypothetical protein